MGNKIGLGKNQSIFINLVGPILAIFFAFFAQYIFNANQGTNWIWLMSISENQRLLVGSGFYLLAVILWFICSPLVNPIVKENNEVNRIGITNFPHRNFRIFLLVLSGVIYLFNNLLFDIQGENSTIRILWVISITTFILAQISWPNQSRIKFPDDGKSPPFRLENWIIFGLILAFSFWLRIYQLTIIPDDLHGDMASYGLQARDLLSGVEQNIFRFGWSNIPMIGYLPAYFSMFIFGNNLFGLNIASVLGGTISIFAVYLLVWRLFDNHRLAAITSLLLAINIPHIHFSRIAAYMDPWPFGFLAFFFVIDGIRSKRFISFGLAGILIGLSTHMYFSGRVIPLIIASFVLYLILNKKNWIQKNYHSIFLLLMGFLLAIGPLIIVIFQNAEAFLSRSSEVFLFDPSVMTHLINKYEVDSVFDVILMQTRETFLMFNYVPDTSTQFGFRDPMFNALLSPLIILGIGSAIRRKREIGMVFIFIWMGLMMVLGSILTVDAPFWPRLVGIFPVGAILAALAINQILNLRIIYTNKYYKIIAPVLCVFLIVYIGWVNWVNYYKSVDINATGPVLLGRYFQQLPLDVTVCGFMVDPPLNVREIIFLSWPRKLVDFAPDAPNEDLGNCNGSSLVWILTPEDSERLKEIYQYWPLGKLLKFESPHHSYTYFFYLTGKSPPSLLPQDILQKDLISYQWKYFAVLGGLCLIGTTIWGLLRKNLLISRLLILKIYLQKKYKEKIIKQDFTIIFNSFFKRLRNNNPIKSAWFELGNVFLNLVDEITHIFDKPLFQRIRLKTIRDVGLFLVPIAIAYVGQMILNAGRDDGFTVQKFKELSINVDQRLLIAGAVFLVASVIWVLKDGSLKHKLYGISKTDSIRNERNAEYVQNYNRQPKSLLNFGVICLVISTFFYWINGENELVRWLWFFGLVMFVIYLLKLRKKTENLTIGYSPEFKSYHILLLGAVLIVAFVLRIYRLYDYPLDLSTDMASVGLSARDYLLGNENRIFGTGWYYMPRWTFLPYVGSMWVAGNNLFGLYFGTVVMGTLSILAIYLLIWRLFDQHRLALLTSIIITINPAHINYSRIPCYIDPWFFGFFCLFFFFDGLKSRRITSFAFSGILTAFTVMSYPSGRIIIPMIGLIFFIALLFKRDWLFDNYSGFVWFVGSFLLTLGPNLVYIVQDWETFMQRANEVFVFSAYNHTHVRYSYETNNIWEIIWEQVKRTVFSFNFYNDKSPQFSYPYPIFNPVISPLLVLGFFQALRKWNKPEYLFLLASFVMIMVTGGILTVDTPNWPRLLGAFPMGAFLIAIVLDNILVFSASFSKYVAPLFVGIWIAGILITVGIRDWRQYIDYVSGETRPIVFVGRYIDSLPDDVTACGLTDGYSLLWAESAFLGWPHTLTDVPVDIPQITVENCPGENILWILSPMYQSRLDEIREIWPVGTTKEHYKFTNEFVFISYLVSK
ncbi:MAG: glycosyltransferase family 39 protein [Anaerolineaceae bacterium]|nr:glycosyltransferase family 39 protein [Anaerolineaceae bacterium]